MDGRVMGGGKLGLAGSGILLPKKGDLPQPKYLKILEKMVKNDEITAITWHKGCGAVSVWIKTSEIKGETPENEAKKFSDNLARYLTKKTGKPVESYEAYSYGQRNEGGIYIDFTNALVVDENMRNGFVLNPKLHGDVNQLLNEIEIAINISFSASGRNERHTFSLAEKFFIEIVAKEDLGNFRGIKETIKEFIKKKFPEKAELISVENL